MDFSLFSVAVDSLTSSKTGAIATVFIGLLGAIGLYTASHASQGKTGREPWDPKVDVDEYDYIIIGGGTAGCVLAARLAEDPDVSVLILEAGGSHDMLMTRIPMAGWSCYGTKHDWKFVTVPQVFCNNRKLNVVRGKLLGGCSSINGMEYTRSPASDFDEWERQGNPGWAYKDVLKYFKKSEGFHDANLPQDHPQGIHTPRNRDFLQYDTFEPEFHGTDGPWKTGYHHFFGASMGFIRGCMAEGLDFIEDINGSKTLGTAHLQDHIKPNGARSSPAFCFLGAPGVVPGGKGGRGKIRVVLHAFVRRILLEEDASGQKRAVGVEFVDERNQKKGKTFKVFARDEVLLCSGAMQSPQILVASGICPTKTPIHPSIPVLHHLPGIGMNMTDHIGVGVNFRATRRCHTVHKEMNFVMMPRALYRYYVHGTGVLTSKVVEAAAFVRLEDIAPEFVAREKANGTWKDLASSPTAPHIEILFACAYSRGNLPVMKPDHHNYYTMIAVLLNPASEGSITFEASEDGLTLNPLLDPNYLSDNFDVRVMREAIKFIRRLGDRMKLDPEVGGDEYFPGEEKVPSDSNRMLDAYLRCDTTTFYHNVGTCKMGPASDPMAVVDHELKVHGISQLRVVDASIIPRVPSGHTCGPTIMVAEKAADMIKESRVERPVAI
ncbi:hypothetical protein DFQ27_007793 [Actinomortierella ambigua]|uniref:Glucose-methanol-choline oxidoreductase N-terminal domain-containing protein n=1 Tax=Actinomortierella ambigua TaxID=1343610 RepID=A0A9P6PVF0_9FUNG|nr:hypothetical protein DFQ27_007793 [Actinomortierella ambigua]